MNVRKSLVPALSALALASAACGTDPLAEPTSFTVRVENVSPVYENLASGAYAVPVGASMPGPVLPGDAYAFEFFAGPGSHLSFANMLVQSNDWIFATPAAGLPLFDGGGLALSGDITDRLELIDAGTELDQEPGAGADQPLMQAGPNTGMADPTGTVRMADTSGLPHAFPMISELIAVTVTPGMGNHFRVEVANVSTATTLSFTGGQSGIALAPGVFAIHGGGHHPLYELGMAEPGAGLENLAEDGDPSVLAGSLEAVTGLTTPIAPGIFAVHVEGSPLFAASAAADAGLEALAEDGNPAIFESALTEELSLSASGAWAIPTGASAPAPAFPGEAYEFTLEALPGDRLSLATMLVQSNDLFIGFEDEGLPLFDAMELPISGDVSGELILWDAGTEVDEAPGAGPNQAPRQAGANTGLDEAGTVRIADPATWPMASEVVRVTITPAS